MRRVHTYKPTKLQLDIIAEGVQTAINKWAEENPYDESMPKEKLHERARNAEQLSELFTFIKLCQDKPGSASVYIEIANLSVEEQQELNKQ